MSKTKTTNQPMNPLLESVANRASEDLLAQFREANDDILAAIHKMQAEAQLQETRPKFNIGFKIVLDFDKSTFDCDLSWTVRQFLSTSHTIEDPLQGKLPIADGAAKMTITSGDKSVTITAAEAKEIKAGLAKFKDK